MAVAVERERHGGMAEPFADDLRVNIGLQTQRGVAMAKIVQADAQHPGALHEPIEALRHALGD